MSQLCPTCPVVDQGKPCLGGLLRLRLLPPRAAPRQGLHARTQTTATTAPATHASKSASIPPLVVAKVHPSRAQVETAGDRNTRGLDSQVECERGRHRTQHRSPDPACAGGLRWPTNHDDSDERMPPRREPAGVLHGGGRGRHRGGDARRAHAASATPPAAEAGEPAKITLRSTAAPTPAAGRAALDAALRPAREARPDRHQGRLRARRVRRLHGPHRRHPPLRLHDARAGGRGARDHHPRGPDGRRGARRRSSRRSSRRTPSSAATARPARSWPPRGCCAPTPSRRSRRSAPA